MFGGSFTFQKVIGAELCESDERGLSAVRQHSGLMSVEARCLSVGVGRRTG